MKIQAVLAIAAGVLVAGLSGTCTLAFATMGGAAILPIALLFGAPFIVGGVVLVRVGIGIFRKERNKR